jgi:acetylglutamate kinase
VQVNPEILQVLADANIIPVVCSVAAGLDGEALNVNADSAAAAIAVAIGATKLILLTDTNGVLSNKDDPNSTISSMSTATAREMIANGTANRGMIPKLEAGIQALEDGVAAVHLINGSSPNALLVEVLTEAGIGTMLVRHND